MATLSDWLATCQPAVPAMPMPGVSIPAVTTKLEKMKADMRKGKRTGSPVSALFSQHSLVQASLSTWCIRTRVKCAVNRLLRYPHLRRHLQDLALLVLNDQTLCALEASGRCEECAVRRMSALPFYPVCHAAALQAQGHTDPCEPLPIVSFSIPSCAGAKLMMSHLGSDRFAACRTRPQYVLRSYWDAGRSLLPGREADMSEV